MVKKVYSRYIVKQQLIMKLPSFITSMLSGGDISVKRVIGFMGFLFLAATMTANSFSPKDVAPSEELVEAVKYITIAALFGNTLEKFTGLDKKSGDS